YPLTGNIPHPDSFPTRRSSDLKGAQRIDEHQLLAVFPGAAQFVQAGGEQGGDEEEAGNGEGQQVRVADQGKQDQVAAQRKQQARSEEHTSELQSREKLVCRLLL